MAVASDLRGVVLGGRYELLGLVGEGAFGRVYRARDRRLDRLVAVKVMRSSLSPEHGRAADVAREARLLARLSDPGIVAVHDIGEDPEGSWCVSELVDGEDLAHRLAAGPLPVGTARSIAVGMCRGLAAAHALGIVHRDVKPGNVLLARDGGGVKVADFGVARLAEAVGGSAAVAAESVVVGTPRYMAPEQARGDAVTPAADVYSAGVVVYEMLAGHTPFGGDSPVAVALAHLTDPPPALPATVPPGLARIVMRALAKDPAARFPDAGAMADALGAGDDGRPATVRQPRRGRVVVFNPAARRRSAALVAAAALLCAGLAAAAALGGGAGAHAGGGRGTLARDVLTPVDVPLVVKEDVSDASARLRAAGLRVSVVDVPAPGITPGTVTSQTPAPGAGTARGSVVRLAVSEVPRWRTVATVTGRTSAALRIRGLRWRIVVSASHARSCSLWVFCHSSSASVTRVGQASPFATFGVGDAAGTHVLASGPGVYRIAITPASGATRWAVRVQDDY